MDGSDGRLDGRPRPPRDSERLTRPHVPVVDSLLGERLPVLDDGFVRVVDYMGDEAAIVQAARVSYGSGTRQLREDRALIRYLLRHSHTTPFEMCEIKLHVRAPMDVWRQWIRHRTANVNEYSTRYSVAIDSAQKTGSAAWRSQARNNRQGSGDCLPESVGAQLSQAESELQTLARSVYTARLSAGVAREQARKDLPLSTYTEAYWKVDLHNLLHFLRLRMAAEAQCEIRQYAEVIGRVVALWVPNVWEAVVDYQQKSLRLSGTELTIVKALIEGRVSEARDIAQKSGLLEAAPDGTVPKNRERTELEAKLAKLGISSGWS